MSNRRRLPRGPKRIELDPKTQQYVDDLDAQDGRTRSNSYTCTTCQGTYVTVDVDSGVTPMLMRCFATEGCPGEARSGWYKAVPALNTTLEWYRPETAAGLRREELDHVLQGGLIHRASASAPDWVKRAHGNRVAAR